MFWSKPKKVVVEELSDNFVKIEKRVIECLASAIVKQNLIRSHVFNIVDLSIHRSFCTFNGVRVPLNEGESAKLYDMTERKHMVYEDEVDSGKLKYL
jgi:hypothetical protein